MIVWKLLRTTPFKRSSYTRLRRAARRSHGHLFHATGYNIRGSYYCELPITWWLGHWAFILLVIPPLEWSVYSGGDFKLYRRVGGRVIEGNYISVIDDRVLSVNHISIIHYCQANGLRQKMNFYFNGVSLLHTYAASQGLNEGAVTVWPPSK